MIISACLLDRKNNDIYFTANFSEFSLGCTGLASFSYQIYRVTLTYDFYRASDSYFGLMLNKANYDKLYDFCKKVGCLC